MKRTTKCECAGAGFCSRHKCNKSSHLWRMCLSNKELFQQWEKGFGPNQGWCPENEPAKIAPLRDKAVKEKPWEGACRKKPWEYGVTAVIPVLDTPETLQVALELLRLQSLRPFIVIIDTGSTAEKLQEIEQLRAADVEIHSLRLNGVRHPSDFPAMAMDLAFSICRTPYLFATHADCFLCKQTLLADMARLCTEDVPVVGYELSPRQHPDWKGMFGHTCTMFHMRTMDRIGAGWSMRRLATLYGLENHEPRPDKPNWPDTELLLNYIVRDHGIEPKIIGHEENFIRNKDENIDHCRSLTGALLYNPAHYEKALAWAEQAMTEAQERIEAWKRAV